MYNTVNFFGPFSFSAGLLASFVSAIWLAKKSNYFSSPSFCIFDAFAYTFQDCVPSIDATCLSFFNNLILLNHSFKSLLHLIPRLLAIFYNLIGVSNEETPVLGNTLQIPGASVSARPDLLSSFQNSRRRRRQFLGIFLNKIMNQPIPKPFQTYSESFPWIFVPQS